MQVQRKESLMQTRKIYFAGALFNHKDIIGNLLLAKAVECLSEKRYCVMLPQDCESNNLRNVNEIRDRDLELLFSCDCIVASFDGTELDSGTVVEFCFAKQLGLPAVLLRTDFRKGGDNGTEPWNLMCSGYPRTTTLLVSAMEQYHRLKTDNALESAEFVCRETALLIINALDELFAAKPLLSVDEAERVMNCAVKTTGGILAELFPVMRIKNICRQKQEKGVY